MRSLKLVLKVELLAESTHVSTPPTTHHTVKAIGVTIAAAVGGFLLGFDS